MPIVSAEALTISALLNNHDVTAGRSYGLRPEHFRGYRDQYNWLLNYHETYGTDPSRDAFRQAFPTFLFSDHEDIRSAIDMVFRAFAKSNITEAMTESMQMLKFGEVEEAYARLVAAEPLRTSPKPRKLLTDAEFLDNWDAYEKRVYTPYPTLNNATGGMKEGQIWYLAARPKNGKSAHLVNFAKRAVLDGCRIKLYSLEMSEAEVRGRFHAALATHYGYKGISLTAIRDRTVDKHTYKQFVGELQDRLDASGGSLDIHTAKQGLVTPGVVAAGADEYDLNMIDYIGLMRLDSGGRTQDWQNLASISNDLKLLAGSAATTFLIASQINRDGDSGTEPPKLSNLAGSDALGQDGDVVLTMRGAGAKNYYTTFSIEGNRHGWSSKFYTKFDPNHGVYDEITYEEAEDIKLSEEGYE